MARKKTSKAKRIQDFLSTNPEARNREVVEALAAHSVTAADVSNAKSQLKRKQLGLTPSASAAKPRSTKASTSRKAAKQSASTSSISLNELELTAGFIKSVGDLNRAQELLQMVAQIQAI